MGKKIKINAGEVYNGWKVLEANVINPDTKSKIYINKPLFSKCLCLTCNITEKYILNSKLKNATSKCHSCSLKERNLQSTIESAPKIGEVFGKLIVIGDGGYKEHGTKGKKRHCSLCKCVCGKEKIIMDTSLKTGNTTSCGCIASKGEDKIRTLLNENNLIYDFDSVFPDLLKETQRRLRFDFIIYNNDGSINRFIEFDGNQHKTGMWGGSWSNIETLEVIQERDEIKNNFCLKHNYILIRIPYHKIETLKIEDIMTDKYKYKKEE